MQVTEWTGREAHALRLALRMSVRAFARHLGASDRTVSAWDARLETIKPGHEMQAVLDTVLERADQQSRDRFTELISLRASSIHPVSASLPNTPGPADECLLEPLDSATHAAMHSTASDPRMVGIKAGSAREESQRLWRHVRDDMNMRRCELARKACALYPSNIQLPHTSLIAPAHWIPNAPIPLGHLSLDWTPGPQDRALLGTEVSAGAVLPMRDDSHRYERYTAAIRYLDPPRLFENRPSFRLLDVDLHGSLTLRFGLSTYFEKLDICEAVGHEFAAACRHPDGQPGWQDLPYRRAIGNPFDLSARAVNPAITTLTILFDPGSGDASFLMHWRDASKVATAGGLYDVIPAGEFQPASIHPWQQEADLDLWRNMAREYSEELLGEPEHDGSRGDPLDYERWPFYRNLTRAREEGRIHAYALGVGMDALTLAATIPTVVVIELSTFEAIFGTPVTANAEGTVVAHRQHGTILPGVAFNQQNVERFLLHEPIAPPGAACLALSWRHRDQLLPRHGSDR